MQNAIVGLTGSILLPNMTGNLDQWIASIDINTGAELLDVSHYGGPLYRQRVTGLKDLAGSATGFLTKGNTNSNPFIIPGTSGTMTITFDSGCTISFQAVIGNVRVVGQFAGLNIVTFSWAYDDSENPTTAWVTS